MWKKLLLLLKTFISSCLLIFSFIIVCIGISTGSNLFNSISAVEFALLFTCWTLLAISEGFQVAVLRIQHMSRSDLESTGCERSLDIHKLVFGIENNYNNTNNNNNDGDGIVDNNYNNNNYDSNPKNDQSEDNLNNNNNNNNNNNKLKRLLVGQSFLVVLCSFIIAQLTTFPLFNYPFSDNNRSTVEEIFFTIFFRSGLPGIVVTVTMAQLLPSLLAKSHPVEFLNIRGVKSVVRLAMFVESLGLVSLLQLWVPLMRRMLFGDWGLELGEKKKSWLDLVKVLVSVVVTACSVVFVVFSIFSSCSSFPSYVWIQGLLLFLSMFIVFMCEGMKIAVLSCHTSSSSSEVTCDVMKLLQSQSAEVEVEERNEKGLEKFMLGRQLIVVPIGFLIAQITHFQCYSSILNLFLYTIVAEIGIPMILVLLQFAQLTPQLLAEKAPIKFLRLRCCYCIAYFAFVLESLGLTTVVQLVVFIVETVFAGREKKHLLLKNPLVDSEKITNDDDVENVKNNN